MKVILENFYRNIAPGYLENRRRELAELQVLSEHEDLAELSERIHRIAGSGGGFGLTEISVISQEIERAICEGDYSAARSAFARYRDYVQHLEVEFETDTPEGP